MKKSKKIIFLALTVAFICLAAVFSASALSKANEAKFEKQLAAFPESYHPYLRQLHADYPSWQFEAFETGLDWEKVINNEHDDYALVYNPDAAKIFKSLDADDYDAENDRYYYKDGAFVAASRVAVEYFMDPRNFLDKGGIFQFELLNFSPLYTVEMVEAVLEGSFMSKCKMTWIDENGKSCKSALTYAETIYRAGETYDINPCFIASKILNEVGAYGSASVTGDSENYPGIYNFYNIGATDGPGAVERGLLWASGSGEGKTSYTRPWTSPYRSIMGGAQFLAEEYIAAGQFTGYLQRFNVNPDCDYELYTHQYMSNLTGALSQGYSTYKSYRDMGVLDEKLVFSIPVFKNMSNEDGSGKLRGAESTEQYGTIINDYRYVRTGPSIDHDILTTAAGTKVYVKKGDEVKILQKTDTDAYYYEEILAYPYWYKVSFTFGSKTYKGYIPASRVNVITTVHVAKGETDIALAKHKNINNKIFASDPSRVKIIDGNTVNFLKNGYVKLYFYDSWGHIEEISFKVGEYKSYYSSSVKATVSGKKATVSSKKHATAQSYGYSLCDKYGNIVTPDFTSKTSRVFEKLKDGRVYDAYAQNRFSKYIYTKAVQAPVVIKPQTVKNLDFIKDSSLNCHLTWDAVSEATGYQIMSYDEKTKKYTKIATVSFGEEKYTVKSKQAKAADKYVVRAYSKYDGVVVYGSYSDKISLSSKAPTPSAIKFSSKSTSGFTLEWTGNKVCDGYQIYVATEEQTKPYYYKTVTTTSLKVSGFKKVTLRKYKIRSFINTADGKIYSEFTPLEATLTLPKQPQKLTLSAGSDYIKASWAAVEDAEYYNLSYKKNGGRYKTVKVNGTSYTAKSLSSYSDYSFYVTAVAKKSSVSSKSKASDTASVKTKPAIPKGLKVTYQGYNHIDLSWDENEKLDSYRVYYMNSAGKELGSVETEKNSIRIKKLSPLTDYQFKIKGYKSVDGKNIASDYSQNISSETVIPVVEGHKVSDVGEKSFRLSWDKLEGAVNYNLYYKKDGVYKKIMKPKTNSCTVTALPASSKGYFYLTATFGSGSKVKESEKTKTFTASVKPSKVKDITVEPTVTTVKIKWDKVKNATGYRVYLVKNGKYVYKKTVTSNSCTLTGLTSCTSTQISVRAYITSSVGTVYGEHVKKSFYTKPVNVAKITQSNKTDTSYTLTWDESSATVNRYYVYRYNTKSKEYERIAITTKPSYDVKDVKPGTSQQYTVVAVYVKDGKVVSKSEKVCDFKCSTYLQKVQNIRLVWAKADSLKIAWNIMSDATAYRVYYYSPAKKGFKFYKETESNGMTISGLASKQEYTFRVNAVKRSGDEEFVGYYSSNITVKTK